MFNKILLLIFLFTISSCASNEVRIRDINKPIKVLQSAVFSAMPNGRPKVDRSKRKFVSKPFLVKGEMFIPISNSRTYYVSNVEILGDRRPYTIYIESFKMARNGGQFVVVGKDSKVSDEVAKAIQYELSKRLKKSDVIDDFRVF